jgi:hypothetical protein
MWLHISFGGKGSLSNMIRKGEFSDGPEGHKSLPLTDAERIVAEVYMAYGWDVTAIKFGNWAYSLQCLWYGPRHDETHMVQVIETLREPQRVVAEYSDDMAAEEPSWKYILARISRDPSADRSVDPLNGVYLSFYELPTFKEVGSLKRTQRLRSTKAEIRDQQTIVIMECRERGWTWSAIARRVNLPRTTVRRIWRKTVAQ